MHTWSMMMTTESPPSLDFCDPNDPSASAYNTTVPIAIHVVYTTIEIMCSLFALAGNLLVLIVFARCRPLRTVTNYYVISLAVADLLVATVGIPSAISTSVGLPQHFHLCLIMNSVLMLFCTGSILSLVAVTVDRFWAIVHPMTYAIDMTKKRAKIVIACCWLLAAVIGLLPAAGWYRCRPREPRCFFLEVMDIRYLVFVYFTTIICPVLFMAVVYSLIYNVVRKQVRKMSLQTLPVVREVKRPNSTTTQMSDSGRPITSVRLMSRSPSSSEERAAKGIAVIVILFVISWLPLYTVNAILCFRPDWKVPEKVFHGLIILSHCNSAWNPVLYAWGMRDFRSALRKLVCREGRGGDIVDFRYPNRTSATAPKIVAQLHCIDRSNENDSTTL